jgi:hypothetical protein
MAVTVLDSMSATENSNPSGNLTISTGSDRCLVLAVWFEMSSTPFAATITVGGESPTQSYETYQATPNIGQAIYLWDESAIAAMDSAYAVSFTPANTTDNQCWAYGTYAGVSQSTFPKGQDSTYSPTVVSSHDVTTTSLSGDRIVVISMTNSSIPYYGGSGLDTLTVGYMSAVGPTDYTMVEGQGDGGDDTTTVSLTGGTAIMLSTAVVLGSASGPGGGGGGGTDVSVAQAWSSANSEPTGSVTIGTGTDRLLVATVHYEIIGDVSISTFTIGGQSATGSHQLFYDTTGDDLHVFVYYWDESDIDSMSGSTVSFTDDVVATKVAWSVATFEGVDQTSPISFNDATGSTVSSSNKLSVTTTGEDGDWTVIPTSCRDGTTDVSWDVNITEEWEIDDADGGGATFALADDAWSQSSHETWQSAAARSQAAVGVVIAGQSGSTAMMYRMMQRG